MFIYMKLYFLCLQLCLLSVCQINANYFSKIAATLWSDTKSVDPHSFYYDKHTKTEVPPSHGEHHNSDLVEYETSAAGAQKIRELYDSKMRKQVDISDEIMTQRLVNILLSRGHMQKDGSVFKGYITLEATESEYNLLKEFGLGKESIRKVDPILDRIIKSHNTVTFISIAYYLACLTEDCALHIITNYPEFVLPVIAALYLYWLLRNVKFTFRMIITTGFQVMFVASFFITWWNLIQEEHIKHTVKQVKYMTLPAHCDGDRMTWSDSVISWFRHDDCQKYYEAVMKNPVLEVTPVQALTHMLAKIILEPLVVCGKSLNSFLTHFTENMSWFSSTLVSITALPTILITIAALALFYMGGSVHIGPRFFSFLTLKGPTNSTRQNPGLESYIDRNPIQVMSKENLERITQGPEAKNHVQSVKSKDSAKPIESCSKNEKMSSNVEDTTCVDTSKDCKINNTSKSTASSVEVSDRNNDCSLS